jgi:hypothetical protein
LRKAKYCKFFVLEKSIKIMIENSFNERPYFPNDRRLVRCGIMNYFSRTVGLLQRKEFLNHVVRTRNKIRVRAIFKGDK